jgi:4-hydroxybenzoate polyprenyltransferase
MIPVPEEPVLLKRGQGLFAAVQMIKFIVFTNIFIVICSLVMSVYTSLLFKLPVNYSLLLFTASGTLCSYSLHWALPSTHLPLSPRERWSRANRVLLLLLFCFGFLLSFYSFLELRQYFNVIVPLIILTFLYSSGKLPAGPFRFFRKYFIGKTIYLAAMWTLVTAFLPLYISGLSWNASHSIFIINRFFFLFAICILFDLRDRDADSAQGIRSLITLLNPGGIRILFYSSLALSFLSTTILYKTFTFTELIIIQLPAAVAVFIYSYSVQTRSELWFFFFLDGLMMLSGLLSLAALILPA